jgi:hypothetical protein
VKLGIVPDCRLPRGERFDTGYIDDACTFARMILGGERHCIGVTFEWQWQGWVAAWPSAKFKNFEPAKFIPNVAETRFLVAQVRREIHARYARYGASENTVP